MSDTTTAALIAASAAIGGAAVGVSGGIVVEAVKARISQREKDFERLIQAVSEFHTAANEWIVGLESMPNKESVWFDRIYEELVIKAHAIRLARTRLETLGTDRMIDWLRTEYEPVQKKAHEATQRAVMKDEKPDIKEEATHFRDVLTTGVDICREELQHVRKKTG